MPATALATATSLTSAGVLLTGAGAAVDNANGNTFANDGKKYLWVNNASGGSLTVTITAFPAGGPGAKPDGLSVTNQSITVATATAKLIGPFKQAVYNDGSGNVNVGWSTGTSVTCIVLDATPNP